MAKTLFDTTITDKKEYVEPTIIDGPKYDKLKESEQKVFLLLRNSMLEIFPTNENGTYDIECLRFAENYAFINFLAFSLFFDQKLIEFETKIKQYIDSSNKNSKLASGG